MAYSDFTFSKIRKRFGIEQDVKLLFDESLIEVAPSSRLAADISDGKNMTVVSEKAKSEFLIAPIIRELQRNNPNITIFSGVSFNVENEKELTGVPDFLMSARPRKVQVEAPVFCLLEAKNQSIEEGLAQCAAEMYAARLFNQQTGDPYEIIYGAVTNAFDWVFLKLEDNTIFIDSNRYYLNELPKILGVFQVIIDSYK